VYRSIKKSLVFLFALLFLYGGSLFAETQFDKIVLDAILSNECLKIGGKYYPYFIRINGHDNFARAKKFLSLQNITWKRKVLICKEKEQCVYIAKGLIKYGIKNIDIGPYQINYIYHPLKRISRYFSFKESKKICNRIIQKLGKKYGYGWETLGKYHSFKKEKNRNYYMKLYAYIYEKK